VRRGHSRRPPSSAGTLRRRGQLQQHRRRRGGDACHVRANLSSLPADCSLPGGTELAATLEEQAGLPARLKRDVSVVADAMSYHLVVLQRLSQTFVSICKQSQQ